MSDCGIVVQARMGSSRLPGKALAPIYGKPLLRRLCDRLRSVTKTASIVVATGDTPADGQIAEACQDWGVPVMRGPEQDVLSRFLMVIDRMGFDAVVRVTGDNPLTDPEGIDELIRTAETTGADIVHSGHRLGYPYGTGAELLKAAVLRDCDRKLTDLNRREDVFVHARKHPELYSSVRISAPARLLRPGYFLTVDYPEDRELLERIYEQFGGEDSLPLDSILALLDRRPELAAINAHLHRGFAE